MFRNSLIKEGHVDGQSESACGINRGGASSKIQINTLFIRSTWKWLSQICTFLKCTTSFLVGQKIYTVPFTLQGKTPSLQLHNVV